MFPFVSTANQAYWLVPEAVSLVLSTSITARSCRLEGFHLVVNKKNSPLRGFMRLDYLFSLFVAKT
jgi:hypothetical protein